MFCITVLPLYNTLWNTPVCCRERGEITNNLANWETAASVAVERMLLKRGSAVHVCQYDKGVDVRGI